MRKNFSHFLSLLFILFWSSIYTIAYSQTSHENNLIKSYENENNRIKKFKRLLTLGEYYKINNITKADSIRHVIIKESEQFPDSVRFYAYLYNGEIAKKIGNQKEYFKIIIDFQPLLKKLTSNEIRACYYKHLGFYYSCMQEIETADFYLKQSIKLSQKKIHQKNLSEAYSFLAKNFMISNKKDSALFYSKKAISSARRMKNKSALAEAFNTQAEIYSFFGQIELSVAKNLISLQMVEESYNIYLLAKYTREIGKSQKLIFNLNDAEYYFKRSLNYSLKISDKRQMSLALTNLASVQLERNEFSKAIKNASLSIDYLTSLNDLNGLGETHSILGIVYKEQKKFNLASLNFNKALVYYESANNKEKIASVYHNVGTVFKEQGKYKNALNYLNRSVAIREQYGAQNQIYQTYRTIADVYKQIRNNEKSLKYMELYLNYLDSNTALQSATKIAELSESYRSEQRERLINSQSDSIQRKEQERKLTATKLENSQLRNNLQTYIILAFLIIAFLAGIIIFYRWNETKIKQQQKEAEMSQTLLRAQMNPHFIFNAMSVIQSYIYDNDIKKSEKFLINFSRLMRLILENSPKEYISINTEMEILKKYLEMQKLRFEDRFEFDVIADEILFEENTIIPPMITQPFIENAIEHGQLHTIKGGFIKIKFSKQDNMLTISIVDNGVGRKATKKKNKASAHKSMAMNITSERIKHLNKKSRTNGSLVIEDYNKKLETGTKILISLPYSIDYQNLV